MLAEMLAAGSGGGGENVFMQYYASINGGDTIDPGFIPKKIMFVCTFYSKTRGVVYDADTTPGQYYLYLDANRSLNNFNSNLCGIKSIDSNGVITLDQTREYSNLYILATS